MKMQYVTDAIIPDANRLKTIDTCPTYKLYDMWIKYHEIICFLETSVGHGVEEAFEIVDKELRKRLNI